MRANNIDTFTIFLDKYINCFYNLDEISLKNMYCKDNDVIYFDNHIDCDSTDLNDHISKIASFFKSGNLSRVYYKIPIVYETSNAACMITYFKYDGQSDFKIRATFYLEKEECDEWKIRHIHYSENPIMNAEEEIRNKIAPERI